MQTQAYFDDIQIQILHEIRKATATIHIAVAWFTDANIFNLLCDKSKEGVRVELMIFNDSINRNSPIDYQQLVEAGGMFLMVGDKKRRSAIMHNKFCVIDTNTVINGSYNWSKQAQENWENIVVVSDAPELARQYIDEFETILNHEAGMAVGSVDYGKIVIRLEALRNFLEIEDDDDIALQLSKLKKLIPAGDEFAEPKAIIASIESGDYQQAIDSINTYVRIRKQLTVFIDPDMPILKVELTSLEAQITALEDEKSDIEKLLSTYHFRYNKELGELVRQVLRLRTERLKQEAEANKEKQSDYDEAKTDHDAFEQDYQQTLQQQQFRITEAEALELKALFRACTKICHPDKVAQEQKREATELQAQLNEAYAKNDLAEVKKIYEQLQKGIFTPMSETIGDAQKLHRQVVNLRSKVKNLSVTIYDLHNSDAYRKIAAIQDMDIHFSELLQLLQGELDRLLAGKA
jgi:hypothetical protein